MRRRLIHGVAAVFVFGLSLMTPAPAHAQYGQALIMCSTLENNMAWAGGYVDDYTWDSPADFAFFGSVWRVLIHWVDGESANAYCYQS